MEHPIRKASRMNELNERIEASNADIDAVLEKDRKLTIAFLARVVRELREDLRKHLRDHRSVEAKVKDLDDTNEKQGKRLDGAGLAFNEMRVKLADHLASHSKLNDTVKPEK